MSEPKVLLSGLGIPIVAFHDGVSTDDDFANLHAVWLDVGHVVPHDSLLRHQIGHALTRLQRRLFFKPCCGPFRMPLAERGRPIRLG